MPGHLRLVVPPPPPSPAARPTDPFEQKAREIIARWLAIPIGPDREPEDELAACIAAALRAAAEGSTPQI
jgi:hypothetical protein